MSRVHFHRRREKRKNTAWGKREEDTASCPGDENGDNVQVGPLIHTLLLTKTVSISYAGSTAIFRPVPLGGGPTLHFPLGQDDLPV